MLEKYRQSCGLYPITMGDPGTKLVVAGMS
jgi:hypothetical protein